MKACHNLISCVLVIRTSGNLSVMRGIIIPENQGRRWILIMIAVTEPLGLSGNEDNGFADLQ
jgi:hypothetical protein